MPEGGIAVSDKKFRLSTILTRIGLMLAWAISLSAPFSPVQAASTLYVNGSSGNDANLCTFSHPCLTITRAIEVGVSGDSILISAHAYNENLVIDKSLVLIGQSAQSTIVDGQKAGAAIRITGTPDHKPQVHLEKLTFRNGNIGMQVQDAQVNLTQVIISGNVSDASNYGSGIKCLSGNLNAVGTTITNNQAGIGAGIVVNSGCSLSMSNSVIFFNLAGNAAGLHVNGTASLINVTISLNLATEYFPTLRAGGIMVGSGGSATLNHCTVAFNEALYDNEGWQIWAVGTLYLSNTIVQGKSQTGEPNCTGSANIVSTGYNLSSDGTCNLVGTGDLPGTQAQLYALTGNGGPTFTHGLPATSPAVDAAGAPDPGTPTSDQRGYAHCDGDFDGTVQGDIGAFEYQPLHIWLPLTRR